MSSVSSTGQCLAVLSFYQFGRHFPMPAASPGDAIRQGNVAIVSPIA
jgi:hypothetical protein